MCGIAGIVLLQRKEISLETALKSMSQTIAHRGPDDEGFAFFSENDVHISGSEVTPLHVYQSENIWCPKKTPGESDNTGKHVALAHRRLSILDLSAAGHQPMCDRHENLWITFNGEIYNYIEIRKELEAFGYSFRTQTDTEVIIAAYDKWGNRCVEKFNGMWAFVIYNHRAQTLFASRDRFGVKPFYYYFRDGYFCFASEQKAINQLPFVQTGVNDKAIYDFFAFTEQEYQEEGFFTNILELFPSTNLTLDLKNGTLSKEVYYSLNSNSAFENFDPGKYKIYVDQTRELFIESIRLRLRSDVAVGCCLSGGIDSSAIAGAMKKTGIEKAHMFTAVFPGDGIDESKWAKLVADHTDAMWHTTTPDSDSLFRELENLVYCQDIPLWSTSTFAQFKVMNLIKQENIKVVLDGQGGDELFAGYTPHFSYYWDEIASVKGGKHAISELKKKGKLSNETVFWIKENAKKKQSGLLSSLRKLKKQPEDYLNTSFVSANKNLHTYKEIKGLNNFLKHEFINTRLKLYLKCEDRCAMWHSVESRTPFADDLPLIENTFAIESAYKLHNGTSKSLLRDAVKDLLPEPVYKRKDKMGYVTPNNKWLSQHKEEIKNIIGDSLIEYIDTKKLHGAIDELSDTKPENTIVFKALTFAVWKKKFNM